VWSINEFPGDEHFSRKELTSKLAENGKHRRLLDLLAKERSTRKDKVIANGFCLCAIISIVTVG
jgi:hypothetical protein